jgi:retron-type reverse transcriptase
VPGAYRNFTIHDPKKRIISAAPFVDRVVHHAVVNVLEPIYERQLIFDSYACRKGKGTHRALDRAERFLRKFPYYLKTDIVKFFPSVDHEVLERLLTRRLGDGRVLELLRRIIASGVGVFPDDPATEGRPHGIPIGNLTSQFLANVLLDPIDHLIKDSWGIPGYVRYSDDLVLFGHSKEQLRDVRGGLEQALNGLRLRMHEDKTQMRPSRMGLKFLGFVLGREGRRVQQTALRRLNRRRRRWKWLKRQGQFPKDLVRRSLQTWQQWLSGGNNRGIIAAVMVRWQGEVKFSAVPVATPV